MRARYVPMVITVLVLEAELVPGTEASQEVPLHVASLTDTATLTVHHHAASLTDTATLTVHHHAASLTVTTIRGVHQ